MYEYQLTIGLNDRQTKQQKFTVEEAHQKLNLILLNHFNIYAFTMIDCFGCYKHDNGEIVQEPSIRLEIATDSNENAKITSLIKALKHRRMFNQESIMLKKSVQDITFNNK